MFNDPKGNTKAVFGTGGSAVAAVTGSAIDAIDFRHAIVLAATAGATATGTLVVKVQECDTSGGTYADISGASVSFAANSDLTLKTISVDLTKAERLRYLKVVGTVGTDVVEYTATVLLINPAETSSYAYDATV